MDEYLAAIERELRAMLVSPDPSLDTFYGMLRYHLGWTDANFVETKNETGKRIRPLLCLLSCEATGADWHGALPAAVALELAHNFSLIHDDIEDNSDQRRGRPAVWKVWGLAQGLNAGDGMFVLARLALGHLTHCGCDIAKCSAIMAAFDHATLALCQGQFLDIGFESRLDVTVAEYLRMVHGKTAASIRAATHMGAMVGTSDPKIINALASFGENIGLAFQMVDDILGIWGDPAITGKSAATDILSKKKSLPAIIGLTHPQHGAALRKIYSHPSLDQDDVNAVLALLDKTGARAETQRRADEFRAAAHTAIADLGMKNHATELLHDIAERITHRVK